MKKELLDKKRELEIELEKINNKINCEILNEDLENLINLSIDLDNLLHYPILKKYGTDKNNNNNNNVYDLLYQIIKILDIACRELREETDCLENQMEKDNLK